ncbi:DUF3530 family protein [Marinobacter sp.]|uniref:DUF3530 family protein n=1 Tax=Marinobacter sp. TaxID=50741 RepID=UPI0035C738EB
MAAIAVIILWILALPVSAQETTAESDAAPGAHSPADRSMLWTGSGEQALSQTFPESSVWLELENEGRALALFHPEDRTPALGAVVVLADTGETAASGITRALARGLTARGWAVMSLGLEAPSPVLQQILARSPTPTGEEEAGSSEESSSTQSVMIDVMASEKAQGLEEQYRSRIGQALSAAVAELKARGYDAPAVLGIGQAAVHVANYALEASEVSALIWVAPRFYPVDRQALPQLLEGMESRMLELYPSGGANEASDPEQTIGLTLRRAGVATVDRQPVPWLSPPLEPLGDSVASRVSAWLQSK